MKALCLYFQNCFSKFYKMKIGALVEICFWQNLAVKGLKSTFQSRIAKGYVLTRHLPEMWKITFTVSRLPWEYPLWPHTVTGDEAGLTFQLTSTPFVAHPAHERLYHTTEVYVSYSLRTAVWVLSSADHYNMTLSRTQVSFVDLWTTHFILSTKHIGYNKSFNSFEFGLWFCY